MRPRTSSLPLAAAAFALLLAGTPASATPVDHGTPASGPAAGTGVSGSPAANRPGRLLDRAEHGRAAVTALGDSLGVAAARNHLSARALQRLLLHDHTAWLDREGRMYYVEADRAMVGSGGGTAPPAPHPYADTFRLHSLAGSQRTIFLDFDGATVSGTQWNAAGVTTDPQPAFDMDGQAGFGDGEQDMIQEIWRQVAEDYAPFDVDVTTEDPGTAALERTSLDDQQYGMRVLFTPSVQAATAICANNCGGVAYLDVFDEAGSSDHQPAWVFTHLQGNTPEYLATTASHEAGHTFGLQHDGYTGGAAYYDGDAQWAPLMGGPSWGVSQWSKGEYPGADNPQDDVAVISAGGAPLRADDFGDTLAGADPLGSKAAQSVHGLIGSQSDRDVFSFDVPCAGDVHVTVAPESRGADVDLSLQILDEAGSPVVSADPPVAGDYWSGMSGLDDDVTAALDPGTYYAVVDGAGAGYPAAAGYTDYGSLGRYTLDVSGCRTAPDAPTAVGASPVYATRAAQVHWDAPANDGGSPVTGYVVRRTDDPAAEPVHLPADARDYWFSGLRAGQSYAFSVAAENAVGASAPVEVSLDYPRGVPTEPEHLTATGSVDTPSITVTWSPPVDDGGSPVTSYAVTMVDGAGTATTPVTTSGTSYTFTDLAPATQYRFSVHAVNGYGDGPDATSSDTHLPTAPGTVASLAATVTGQRTVTVTWQAPGDDGGSPVTGYLLSSTGPDGDQPASQVGGDVHNAVFAGLRRASQYTFTVQALNAAGTGAPAGVTVDVPAEQATSVQDLTASPDTAAASVHLSWAPPTDDGGAPVSGYRVERSGMDRDGSPARTWTLPADTRSLDDSGLVGGSDFTYTVSALTDWGDSVAAQVITHLDRPTVSGAPASVAATPGNGRVTVTWTPPADTGTLPLTGYRVRWFESGSDARVGTADLSALTQGYTVGGLVNGRSYYVTVAALTGAGVGDAARSAAVVPATTPGRVRVTGAWSGAPGGKVTAKVGWAAPASGGSPITGYRVVALRLSSTGRVVGRTTVTAAASARSATVRLPRKARYRFTVQAVNLLGAGPVSGMSKTVLGR